VWLGETPPSLPHVTALSKCLSLMIAPFTSARIMGCLGPAREHLGMRPWSGPFREPFSVGREKNSRPDPCVGGY
jgi:hypothetical protein